MSPDLRNAATTSQPWEPRIVAFFCNWCTYTAADLAGVSRLKYAPNVRVIRLMCSGRVDPQFIFATLAGGADGVLIGGCHIGDCHYAEGNYKMQRRFILLQRMLRSFGIEAQRVRLEWISAAEGERVKTVINRMVEELRVLGPLALPAKFAAWDHEVEHATTAPRDGQNGARIGRPAPDPDAVRRLAGEVATRDRSLTPQ